MAKAQGEQACQTAEHFIFGFSYSAKLQQRFNLHTAFCHTSPSAMQSKYYRILFSDGILCIYQHGCLLEEEMSVSGAL